MKTPTQMNTSSASSSGIMPSATESCTALATANCAGPNICTACFAPLIVTLLKSTVLGLQGRLGAITAKSVVKPSLLFVRALQKAASTGLPRGPMRRSICATSLPSPTSDSPTITLLILAIPMFLLDTLKICPRMPHQGDTQWTDYPCWQRPDNPDRLAR